MGEENLPLIQIHMIKIQADLVKVKAPHFQIIILIT